MDGAAGNCTVALAFRETCQPTCEAGHTVSGPTRCNAGRVVDPAGCSTCPEGFYCVAGSSAPVACPEKDAEGGQHSCPAGTGSLALCAAGSFCANVTHVATCPAGSWCGEGAIAPAACADGYLCLAGSATNTTLCEAGYYCPEAKEERLCPTGSYCPEGSEAHTLCPDGASCPPGSFELPQLDSECPVGYYCTDLKNPDTKVECTLVGSYCPVGSSTEALCPAGFVCATPVVKVACKDGNLCVAGSTVDEVLCAAGNACPGAAAQIFCSDPGQYCPAGTGNDDLCPVGYYCATTVGAPVECSAGNYCPAGSAADDTPCGAGSYCPTPSEQVVCPSGSYCKAGVTEATLCTAGSNCPAGSTQDPGRPLFRASIVMTGISPEEFLGDASLMEGFREAAAAALGADVLAADVSLDCVCPGSCEVVAGESPEGIACGAEAAAARLRRGLLQDAAAEVGVDYSVEAVDDDARLAYEARMASSDGEAAMQDGLIAGGFAPDVARSASVTVYSADAAAASSVPTAEDFTQVLITVMFAVPVAMLVVGLAMYQNSKKEKPVKLPGLITAVVFAFYDFFSDVWFVATPVPAEYVGFTIAAAVAVGVATLVGAGIVGYSVWHHKVTEWGAVDVATVVLAVTNTDLLALLPWESASDAYEGMPDATTAKLPVVGVVVEDLPQLFIQGFYLISSGDTGNLVVLVSVAMSGCSLLLRFVRGAFAFMAVGSESTLAETSPMKDWEAAKLGEWLASKSAADPVLEALVQRNEGLSPDTLLRLADVVNQAQADLIREAEEAEDGDRNNYSKGDVASSSSLSVLGAAL